MKVGIPRALLYCKYHPFFDTFFSELGCEIVTSPETNKSILNLGTKYCVDEACLPIKIFHGHAAYLRDKCELMFIPRIMQLEKREFICPKFCGLPEMILNSIPNMPQTTTVPLYAFSERKLKSWINSTGHSFTKNPLKIESAYKKACEVQNNYKCGINDKGYKLNIALLGHPYNIYDNFINMNIVSKLNKLGIGVKTYETISKDLIESQLTSLFKKPFWTFAKSSYGFATYAAEKDLVQGIIYISSFACGIDSIVIELIKDKLKDFPFLVLKVDEQTGEAGFNTRIEAFIDMLERRCSLYENNCS